MNEKTKEMIGVEIYTIKTVLPYLCLVIEDIQVNNLLEFLGRFVVRSLKNIHTI